MKNIIISLLTLLLPIISFSQNNKIDSLLSLLKKDKEDTNKVIHLNNVGYEYSKIGKYDSAIQYCNSALQLAQQLNFKSQIAKGYNIIGIVNYSQGDYPKTLEYLLKSLKVYEELKDKIGIAKIISNTGNVYRDQGDYPKALDCFFKSLKIDEELGDKNGIASHLGGIGTVYHQQADYHKALDYYFKALKMDEELGNKNGIAIVLGNIGAVYEEQKDYPKALDYDFKALKIAEELGNKNSVATVLGNIGNVYNEQNDYPKALDCFFKSLKIQEELGNKNGIAFVLGNIGVLYINLKKYTEAEKYLFDALKMDKETGAMKHEMQTENDLSNLHTETNHYQLALEHYKKAMVLKDTIFSQEKNKEITRKEMNYEFEKKEAAQKAEQDKKDAVTAEEKRRQKVITYSVSAGLFLVLLLALFIFRGYRQKQKANVIITQQKGIVEEKNKLVEEKQKEILDSIHYAKRIQRALLASDSYLNKNLPEHFVLYKPKDIVSGDFYWALQANGNFLVLIGDCTGHGVPGAFMSLLNISFLNEVALERKTTRPDLILNGVREEIIKALNPEGTETEGKDGMDCILCSFDFKKNILEVACANNPLWIVRNKEVIEYKPDKMPVGMHSGEKKDFTLQKIELQKGDTIYTFTDGYADQFGGAKGKKFKYKQLEEKILAISDKPMAEQKTILEKTFEEWKGVLEQVDDVLVIGIRI